MNDFVNLLDEVIRSMTKDCVINFEDLPEDGRNVIRVVACVLCLNKFLNKEEKDER